MKIRKMTATFGCLSGTEMVLEDGLNIINAPNESGKSTWSAFIRAMLYGIDSSERQKGGSLPDKTRYAPWSGAPMSGVMEIEHGGRSITLRRSTRLASAPMREFAAVYTGTEAPVPGLAGADAGEALTGVSREVFRRSAFIGQGDVAVTAAAELEKRISSVVSSGEEGTSYSEADDKLRAWQRKRRFNKRGAIPELDSAIEAQSALLEKLAHSVSERSRLAEELERSKGDCAGLAERIAQSREEARRDTTDTLKTATERERERTSAHQAATEAAAVKRAELERGMFGAMSPEEAADKAGADAEKAEGLLRIATEKAPPVLAAVLTVLCLLSAVIGAAWVWQFFMLTGVLAVTAFLSWRQILSAKKNALACAKAREDILRKYGAQSEADIYAAADAHARRWMDYKAANRAEQNAAAALESARAEHGRAQSHVIQGEESEKTLRLLRELSSCEAEAAALGSRLSELNGSLRALGDPMAIESGLLEMWERRARMEEQYDALTLAIETLKEADAEIQRRFSPALGRAAAKYMSRLTGGRYDELTLSRDFTAMAKLAGDTIPRETAYLSTGATDLLYLAVRLAVCELALPEDDPCPLVLDDVLVNFDAERTARAMALLQEIAEKRQVILFTCK